MIHINPWTVNGLEAADILLEENMTFCADIFFGNHEKRMWCVSPGMGRKI